MELPAGISDYVLYQPNGEIIAVAESFENGKQQVSIVMATETGKTRTAMSLVDIFFKSNQVLRILFVADRVPLV